MIYNIIGPYNIIILVLNVIYLKYNINVLVIINTHFTHIQLPKCKSLILEMHLSKSTNKISKK